MKEIWEKSSVTIKGDKEAQLGINNSLYHLHSIAPRHRNDLSIPARGLSGQTYKGAIFWDTEIFILPFFLHTEPSLARSFITYRINGLKGAREKAKLEGYEGAFFAWESQEEGREGCSDFNVIDTFTNRPIRTYFRDKQIHISADIAYAINQYISYTEDYSILEEGALEVLYEIASFYFSRASLRPDGHVASYNDVLGPDEYHERVDNNIFTNMVIKHAFDVFTVYYGLAKNMKINLPCSDEIVEKYQAFSKTIKGKDSNGLPSLVINQFDGFSQLEDITVEKIKNRLIDENEYWGGATGIASNTQVIKQADVIAAIELFPSDFSNQEREANYNYYNPRTEHGSSLSACMYALSAARIGLIDEAYSLFKKSALIDVKGEGKQFAGKVYIGGTHPASQGGSWLVLAMGFMNLKIINGEITIDPMLPKSVDELYFPILYKNKRYLLYASQKESRVEEIT